MTNNIAYINGGTKTVDIVQYVRPDGRKRLVSTEVPLDIGIKIITMQAVDYEFAIEMIGGTSVACYISDLREEEDLLCQIWTNDEQLLARFINAVREFEPDKERLEEGKKILEAAKALHDAQLH